VVFREIVILEVDYTHIEELGSGNQVVAPFILSDAPPEEWKQYFEDHAPANVVIVDNIIRFRCPSDKVALQRHGRCWNTVADLIDDANRHYLGFELRKWQELGRGAEKESKKGAKKEEPSEFEKEWGRYMGRD